jgi:DNA-binding XRE family transcriptional regulator
VGVSGVAVWRRIRRGRMIAAYGDSGPFYLIPRSEVVRWQQERAARGLHQKGVQKGVADQARELRAQGVAQAEIARRLGVSRQAVHQASKGVTVTKKSRYSAPRCYSAERNARIAATLSRQETRSCHYPGCGETVTRRRSHFKSAVGIAFCPPHHQPGVQYMHWLGKLAEGQRPLFIGLVAQGMRPRAAYDQAKGEG